MGKRIAFLLLIALLAGSVSAAPKGRVKRSAAKKPVAVAKTRSSAEWLALGGQLLAQGKTAEAAAALRKATEDPKAPASAFLCLYQAQALLKNDEAAKAAADAFLERASPKNPIEATAAMGILKPRVEQHQQAGRWTDERYKDLGLYLTFCPDPAKELRYASDLSNMAWQKNGRAPVAIAILKSLVERAPNSEQLMTILVMLIAAKGGEEALTYFAKAVELFPKSAMVWCRYGVLLDQNNQSDKALAAYEKAYALNPDLWNIDVILAQSYAAHGRTDEAFRLLKTALETRKDADQRIGAGNALFALCKTDAQLASVREFIQKQLEANPTDPACLATLAQILKKQGDTAGHDAALVKLLDSTNDTNMLESLARRLTSIGEIETAAELYTRLQKLAPGRDFNWAIMQMANDRVYRGEPEKAIPIYRRLMKDPKLQGGVVSQICNILRWNYKGPDQEKLLLEVLAAYPNSPEAVDSVSRFYLDGGRVQEALVLLKKHAFGEGGKSESVQTALIDAAKRADKLSDLVPDYKTAIAKDPSNATLLLALGHLYTELQQYDEAIAEIKKGIAIAPGGNATALLADAYEKSGQPGEAVALWLKFLEGADQDWQRQLAAQALARVCPKAGKLKEGVAAVNKILAANPKDYQVSVSLAQLYTAGGRIDEAFASWRVALANADQDWQRQQLIREFTDACQSAGKPEEGIAILKKLAAGAPTDVNYAQALGDLCLASERLDEAAAAYAIVLMGGRGSWQVFQPVLYDGHRGDLMMDILAAVRVNDRDEARKLISFLQDAVNVMSGNSDYDSIRVEIARQAREILGNLQARFPGTDIDPLAAWLSVHVDITNRVTPKKQKPNEAAGARVIEELTQIQRLYPDSPVCADCARDIMSVLTMLNKKAERDAYELRMIDGELGSDVAKRILYDRADNRLRGRKYQEAITDLNRLLSMADPANVHEGMAVRLDLARAYFGMGDTFRGTALAEALVKEAEKDSDIAGQAKKLLDGGGEELKMSVRASRSRVYKIPGDKIVPESTGELTEKVGVSIQLKGLRADPLPLTVRMAVPDGEGMRCYPEDGNPVFEGNKRVTEWKDPTVPSRENEWVTHDYGHQRTDPSALQPIKGLRVSRSCRRVSPGVWEMSLSVSAKEAVGVEVYGVKQMEFSREGITANMKPDRVQPDYITWYKRWDQRDGIQLKATIRITGEPAGRSVVPGLCVSTDDYTNVEAGSRADKKSFQRKSKTQDFTISLDRDFPLDASEDDSARVKLLEVLR